MAVIHTKPKIVAYQKNAFKCSRKGEDFCMLLTELLKGRTKYLKAENDHTDEQNSKAALVLIIQDGVRSRVKREWDKADPYPQTQGSARVKL